MPPFICVAVLRSITNSWCTSARFHDEILPCRMCGATAGDSMQYYVRCPAAQAAVANLLPL
eukprot:9996317-Karenia_brevis.AAC.1